MARFTPEQAAAPPRPLVQAAAGEADRNERGKGYEAVAPAPVAPAPRWKGDGEGW